MFGAERTSRGPSLKAGAPRTRRKRALQCQRLHLWLNPKDSEPIKQSGWLEPGHPYAPSPPCLSSNLGEVNRFVVAASKRNQYRGKPHAVSIAEELE